MIFYLGGVKLIYFYIILFHHIMSQIPTFKFVLLGDSAVGKTSFMTKQQTFGRNYIYEPSEGVIAITDVLSTSVGKINLNVWDIPAGDEKDSHMDEIHGVIIMFDVERMSTFESIDKMRNDVKRLLPDTPMVLLGNKIDSKKREVTDEMIQSKVKDYDAYYHFSAKSNYNFEKPYLYLLRKLIGDEKLRFLDTPAE